MRTEFFLFACLTFPSVLRAAVSRTLESCQLDGPVAHYFAATTDVGFHIQGWRWHTLALRRELSRVGTLAQSLSRGADDKSLQGLVQATDYVVNFNMKGLHRIEKDLFFPWVRTQIKSKLLARNTVDVSKSLMRTLQTLEQQRSEIESIGELLVRISIVI